MKSRDAHGKDHFDLLPFIAILMCVLGCLLLVTMSIAALSIGPGVGEGWLPTRDPGRENKTPILVEWDGTTATIHERGARIEAKWASDAPGNELDSFVNELATKRGTHYALFAVRPSGFANFQQFADVFRNRLIDVGYEPLPQDKSVRLLRERETQ